VTGISCAALECGTRRVGAIGEQLTEGSRLGPWRVPQPPRNALSQQGRLTARHEDEEMHRI